VSAVAGLLVRAEESEQGVGNDANDSNAGEEDADGACKEIQLVVVLQQPVLFRHLVEEAEQHARECRLQEKSNNVHGGAETQRLHTHIAIQLPAETPLVQAVIRGDEERLHRVGQEDFVENELEGEARQ